MLIRLLIGLFLLFHFASISAWEQEKYLHFTEIDGLPRNITTCLAQDQYGYLWIGTGNGIARYDGKNFVTYKELSSVGVIFLYNDSKNNIWAGTSLGIYKYNRITNFFDLKYRGYIPKIQEDEGNIYILQTQSIDKIDENDLSTIYKGNNLSDFSFSKEGIWLSSMDDGVKLLSRESNFKKISAHYLENKFVSKINKLDNNLFIGCHNGQLYTLNEKGILQEIAIKNHYYYNRIVKVGLEYWLGTDGNGILILDKNLKFSRQLSRTPQFASSINSNSIYDILQGKDGEVWLASYGAGVICMLPDNQLFQNIVPEKGNSNALIANEGVSIFVQGPYYYFGTNYGLSAWDENSQTFHHLEVGKLKKDLQGIKVAALSIDANNNLWVGTYDGHLGKYRTDFKLLKSYHPSSEDPNEMQQIAQLFSINSRNLLIVTHYQNRFLLNFDTQKETSQVFELNKKGSHETFYLLNYIRTNQKGEILGIISDKGLYHVNWKENVLENRLTNLNKQINCVITDFYQDKKGFYWITSSNEGLMRISEDGKEFKKWTTTDGLASNVLLRVESIDDRFLWISSISGLLRFDTRTSECINFNNRDGLPANEFNERVSSKTQNGKIIFGSLSGFTIVNPSKMNPDTSKSKVIISDVSFQNQSIRTPEQHFLKEPLEDTKEISLPYSKNSFSIHFFVKDKSFKKYHNYAYRLLGLEKNWIFLGETNFTTYTNLSPGTYTFEIKSIDQKNTQAFPTRLVVHIQAPWYLSWWAYLLYALLFIALIYLSVYAYLKRLQVKKEKEIAEFKIQKEHELSEKKIEFFTNISHDLKTPLTLIDAPVNDLLQSKNLDQEQVNKLMVVRRNARQLYKLIMDLLDFRSLNQKQYVLEVRETNINELIEEIYQAFHEECKHKSINLQKTESKEIIGFVDIKKLEKIIWNLLSNALKFTSSGGSIQIFLEELTGKQKLLKISINDTGKGIAAKDQNKIFDRFYQVRGTKNDLSEGSGIGLSIVKELVEMHHGTISVKSELKLGSSFVVTIPLDRESYSSDELARNELNEELLAYDAEKPKPNFYNRPTLLIVEDNSELREYLSGHFQRNYKVVQAENGKHGLSQALELVPDIILTDVQMPEMNGYEFCKEVRKNFEISHIPLVMLTANSTIDQQIEGLSTGADAYISKPFDIKLLDTTLFSLLENRKKIKIKFLGIEPIETTGQNLPQKDMEFIQDLKNFIEVNLANFELNNDLLSSQFAISNTKLQRKIKALLGTTPNNLIKSIRLKKAYELLQNKDARVSEVAFQTGFSDPNYFTFCFKKEFGENPSQIS